MSLTIAQKAALKDAHAANGPVRLQDHLLNDHREYAHRASTLASLVKRRMLDRTSLYAYVLSEYGLRVCISEGIGE